MSWESNSTESLFQILIKAEEGQQYLKAALEQGSEQSFLLALHNIIDAILFDFELEQHLKS